MDLKEYTELNVEVGNTFFSKSKNFTYKVELIDYPREIIIFSKENGKKAKLSFSFVKIQLNDKNWSIVE